MVFKLSIPKPEHGNIEIDLDVGQLLTIVGANGAGKSSLIGHLIRQHNATSLAISAHRQTWMRSNTYSTAPSQIIDNEQNFKSYSSLIDFRYNDREANAGTDLVLYKIMNGENDRARSITKAVDENKPEEVQRLKCAPSPLSIVNQLFEASNLPIQIYIGDNDALFARRKDGTEYSIAELSDGERNALLIAGQILTAQNGQLIIVDEPERHLHRSITVPLLGQLFLHRKDCAFVVSTHDLDFAQSLDSSHTLIVRSCTFTQKTPTSWDIDQLAGDANFDDEIRSDILGARRTVIFVEGTNDSLDKPLYELIFPTASVIAKGTCADVENSVKASQSAGELHWLRAFGIIDGDTLSSDEIANKKQNGIFTLPFYSVESIYYCSDIIARMSRRQAATLGQDADSMRERALKNAITAVKDHKNRLCEKVSKRQIRQNIKQQIPNDDELINGSNLSLTNNAQEVVSRKEAIFDKAISQNEWDKIISYFPIRETPALKVIYAELGFRTDSDYQGAVRQLILNDSDALAYLHRLFEALNKAVLGTDIPPTFHRRNTDVIPT